MKIRNFNFREITRQELFLAGALLLVIVFAGAVSHFEYQTVTYKQTLPVFAVTRNVEVLPTAIKGGKTAIKVSQFMSVVREKEKDTKVVVAKDMVAQVKPTPLPRTAPAPLPLTPPSLLNQAMPAYPEEAIETGLQGTAALKVLVLKNGRAGEVILERSSSHKILDESALAAAQTWKFSPARRGSQIVEAWLKVPIKFQLKS